MSNKKLPSGKPIDINKSLNQKVIPYKKIKKF